MNLASCEGVYQAVLEPIGFRSPALSPLIVYDDGSVDIAGTVIQCQFDGNGKLTFSQVQIGDWALSGGELNFTRPDGINGQFTGWVERADSPGNPVGYNGSTISTFQGPAWANSVDATLSLEPHDRLNLRASNGRFVSIVEDHFLGTASNIISPTAWFTANVTPDGVRLNVNDDANSYWIEAYNPYHNPDAGLVAVGTSASALVFRLQMNMAGRVMLRTVPDGRYLSVLTDGDLTLTAQPAPGLASEFDVEIETLGQAELLARWGLPPLTATSTACELDIASLCWQTTGGFFLALGLGPYMAGSTNATKIGVMGILKTSPAVAAKITAAWEFLSQNPKATAGAIAALSAGILQAAWSAGILWKVVKFVLIQAGWLILFRLLAHILEAIFLTGLELAQLLASFMVWAGGIVVTAVRISQDCVAKVLFFDTTPSNRWQSHAGLPMLPPTRQI